MAALETFVDKNTLLIQHIKTLLRSRFVKNVALVATGTAGAQVITLCCSPIITRLYGPDAFGVLGVFMSILGVMAPLAALSYPIAIVLPKEDEDALRLVRLSFKIATLTTLCSLCVLFLLNDAFISFFKLEEIKSFAFLIPLAMLFSSLMTITTQWALRKKMFKWKAAASIGHALFVNAAQIAFGLVTPSASILVSLTAFGHVVHALVIWLGARRELSFNELFKVQERVNNARNERRLLKHYRDFALFRTPQIVLNASSQSMPVLMLASFFGPASAGFYALAKMVLAAPTALIGQSVASVFYPRINEAVHNGEDAFKLLIKATAYLAVLGALPFGVVVAFGPLIFSLVFGHEWGTAGEYAQWLALWSYFGFLNRPSVGALPVFGLQGFFLLYELASIALRAAALVLAYYLSNSALSAVAAFSIVSVVLNVVLVFATARYAYMAKR